MWNWELGWYTAGGVAHIGCVGELCVCVCVCMVHGAVFHITKKLLKSTKRLKTAKKSILKYTGNEILKF